MTALTTEEFDHWLRQQGHSFSELYSRGQSMDTIQEIPSDAGNKLVLARSLAQSWNWSTISEIGVLVSDRVWESTEIPEMLEGFRQPGPERAIATLTNYPATLISHMDQHYLPSVIAICLVNLWDSYFVDNTFSAVLFVSHDEYLILDTKNDIAR